MPPAVRSAPRPRPATPGFHPSARRSTAGRQDHTDTPSSRCNGPTVALRAADDPTLRDRAWIQTQWAIARVLARADGAQGGLLVLDEVRKITAWSEVVKRLWDEDTTAGLDLRVVLLGSAPLLVQRGLTESLAGRFELVRVPHWSFAEMRAAFGWDLDRYIYHGGYPGGSSSDLAATTPARSCPTRKCLVSCRTPGTPLPLRTTWSCSPAQG
ncbi:MAG: AAA family ATPase [Pseudonocardiaceae bacterium]